MIDDEMKTWLLDCFSNEDDQDDIKQLSRPALIRAINVYYAGGYGQFLEDRI